MNIREGMRRVGTVFGVLGGIVGAIFGYASARALWDARAEHMRFEAIVSLPSMKKDAKDLAEAIKIDFRPINPPPGFALDPPDGLVSFEVKKNGIDGFTMDKKTKTVTSVTLTDGEVLHRE